MSNALLERACHGTREKDAAQHCESLFQSSHDTEPRFQKSGRKSAGKMGPGAQAGIEGQKRNAKDSLADRRE